MRGCEKAGCHQAELAIKKELESPTPLFVLTLSISSSFLFLKKSHFKNLAIHPIKHASMPK